MGATLLEVDLLCGHCGEMMEESIPDRVYTNDLAGTVVLGERIQLIGTLSREYPHTGKQSTRVYDHGIHFEVNNILRPRNPEQLLPENIAWILNENMSGWNTTQAIIDMLDGIVPSHVYRKLKLALLISAISIEDGSEFKEIGSNFTASSTGMAPPLQEQQVRPAIHVLVVLNSYDTVVPNLVHCLASGKR
ncbi:hypothetical protein BG004_008392 [Podila humilis]|nr:hypothetical protein BG004_008392 [Podila humilis]